MEYLGRVRMALCSHVGSINFADPANIRKIHKELMSHVRTEAIHISNEYKIQMHSLNGTGFFQLYKKNSPKY